MESALRLGLFGIAAFVVALIFYDVWFRRAKRLPSQESLSSTDPNHEPFLASDRQESVEDEVSPPLSLTHEKPAIKKPVTMDDIIVISVLAKPSAHFASYDLLQAISATGMQYGEMDIFHYYQPSEQGNTTLFSLASATKPGKFDLDRMGDFTCLGLSLFMDKQSVQNPKEVFLLMLEKAEQLAEDLDGELRVGPERKPWNNELLQDYLTAMSC